MVTISRATTIAPLKAKNLLEHFFLSDWRDELKEIKFLKQRARHAIWLIARRAEELGAGRMGYIKIFACDESGMFRALHNISASIALLIAITF